MLLKEPGVRAVVYLIEDVTGYYMDSHYIATLHPTRQTLCMERVHGTIPTSPDVCRFRQKSC